MRKIGSIFQVWEADFGSLRGHFWPLGGQIWPLGGQIRGRRPQIEGLGPQIRDPGPWFWPQRGQNLWSQDRFPLWESEFWPLLEVKTLSIWPILGSEGPQKANFRDPSLEKVAEFWPRRGSVLHFWTPKDPQILKVHKMRHPKETSNVGLKNFVFSQSQYKNPFLVAFFLSIQELWLLHNEKRRISFPDIIQISQ